MVVPPLPDLTTLSHAQKDALTAVLWEQVVSLTARLTALERKAGACEDAGPFQRAAVQGAEEEASPFGPSIMAMALHLRFTPAISSRRLCRLFEHMFGLAIRVDAGDAVFLARRRHALAASTRQPYRRRLDRDLDAVMALSPTHRHGQCLRKRCGKVRGDLFTVLIHPDVPPDNNNSERELRPTATDGKVTGDFRSTGGAQTCSPASDPSSARLPAPASTPMRLSATRHAGTKVLHQRSGCKRSMYGRASLDLLRRSFLLQW